MRSDLESWACNARGVEECMTAVSVMTGLCECGREHRGQGRALKPAACRWLSSAQLLFISSHSMIRNWRP